MKVANVVINNKRKEFLIKTLSGGEFSYPYVKTDPRPLPDNQINKVFVDRELDNEAITYVLNSGEEGSIHVEQILEYNEDPGYMAELLTYKLTLEAKRAIDISGLSRRQIARRLQTSVPQLYRLLDSSNTNKSMNQLVTLLHILNCNIDFVVNRKASADNASSVGLAR
jgi:hypothetical protein